MLNLKASSPDQLCRGLSRRELLQVGTLGLGGLTLPWLLRARAAGTGA